MSGNKRAIITSTPYFKDKEDVSQSSLFEKQLSSADNIVNTSLNDFRQQCVSKLKLNKRIEEGDKKKSRIKTYSISESSSNSSQGSQTSIKNALVGKPKIRDICSQESIVEVGTVVKIKKKMCPGCGEDIEETVLTSHIFHCLQRFRKKCPQCETSLSKMTNSQAKQHIDSCKPQKSEIDSSLTAQEIIILDCPFCGKYDNDPRWRKSHMLKCAKSKNIGREKFSAAKELQHKQAKERLAAGLSAQPAKPVVNPKISTRSSSRHRAIFEPTTYDQEEFQMAKAMSLSLQDEQKMKSEENNFFFQALSSTVEDEVDLDKELVNVLKPYEKKKPSKKHKNKKKIPLLFLRSDEDRSKIIAERVAELLSEDKNKFEFPTSAFNVNWKGTFILRDWPDMLPHCRLWNLATRPDAHLIDKRNFYNACFLELENPVEVDIDRCRRISLIPGYNLQSAHNGNATATSIKLPEDELATQDVLEQLLEKNYFKSEGELDSNEEMRDGFITQKEPLFTQNEQVANFGTSLSRNLLEMVDNPILSDVRILVDGESLIHCHRFILFARCPLAFQELKKEKSGDDVYILNWSNISYNGVYAFLKFLYAQILPEAGCSNEVTKLARRYNIPELLSDGTEALSSSSNSFNSVNLEPKREPDAHNIVFGNTVDPSGSHFPRAASPEVESLSPDLFSSTPGEKNVFSYDSEIPETVSPIFSKECEVKENTPRKGVSQSIKNDEDESSITFSSSLSPNLNLDSDAIRETLADAMSSPLTSLVLEEGSIKKRKLFDDSDYGLNLEQRVEKRRRKANEKNISPTKSKRVEMKVGENSFIAASPYEAAPNFSFEDDSLFDRAVNSQEFDISQTKISPKFNARQIFSSTPTTTSDSDLNVPTKKPTKSRKKTISKKAMTPMPRYSIMETPEITKNLKSIGVKNLGKKKGTQLLKHVFKETHKDAEGEEIEVEKAANSQSQPDSSSSSKKDSKKSGSDSTQEDLNQQIEKFIKSRKQIYQDMLHYKPVVLEDLLKQLLDAGIKCKAIQLKDFLDIQSLAFQSTEEKFVRKKKTSPSKKKHTKS